MKGNGLQALKIVNHYANGRFYWLMSGRQSVNHSREAISILSEKYKRFTFVNSVCAVTDMLQGLSPIALRHDKDVILGRILHFYDACFTLQSSTHVILH